MIDRQSSVFVAGHKGLVGSAILRRLDSAGFSDVRVVERKDLDLRDQSAVNAWFETERPNYAFLVAGTVHASHRVGVEKLIYLGSSCIYPREADQPIIEDSLLSGPLEPTNESYALAKIAGIKLCEGYRRQYGDDFISAMPTNLYGPGDNFDEMNGHVLPSLMRRFHEAKDEQQETVEVWGSGKAKREFLHVDDLADACLFLMDNYSDLEHINVGTGIDHSIKELAENIRDLIYPEAELVFDTSKPDGMPRKVLNVSKLTELGWKAKIPLLEGLSSTYDWFRTAKAKGEVRE